MALNDAMPLVTAPVVADATCRTDPEVNPVPDAESLSAIWVDSVLQSQTIALLVESILAVVVAAVIWSSLVPLPLPQSVSVAEIFPLASVCKQRLPVPAKLSTCKMALPAPELVKANVVLDPSTKSMV